ncbi:peroxiredoxin-like family protein [Gammaproteobacteria bacterium AS21]
MATLREQTAAMAAKTRLAKPEFMKAIEDIFAQADKFGQGSDILQVGTDAINFTLPDHRGELVTLKTLLQKGPVVLTFYRGSWCPYCNLQLRALQNRLADIHDLGAQLVAISPQIPDQSLSQVEKEALEFIVLSDQNADIAAQYGAAWQVPQLILDHMRNDRQLDLEQINNGNSNVLSIPATLIIDRSGKITWNYINVDYRLRSEPEDVILALKQLL